VLLGDLQQDAPEMVGHHVGDGGEQEPERFHHALGPFRLGEVGGAQRLAHVGVEQFNGLGGHHPGHGVVATREVEQLGHRQPRFHQAQPVGHQLDVGPAEAQLAVVGAGHEQPLAHEGVEDGGRDAAPGHQVVDAEQLFGGLLGARLGHRRRQVLVGGIEVAVEETADDGEGEAPSLEVFHPPEAVEVLGGVEGQAPVTLRRGKKALLLVVAHGVDGHLGRLGQVLHPHSHE